MMLANLLAGFTLVGIMWDSLLHKTLLFWLMALVISVTLTLILYLYLRPVYQHLKDVPEKLFYYQLPFLFGCIWGAAGYLFLNPNSMTDTAFLIVFLFGMASGGINALSSLWLSYVALVVPILLPFSIKLILGGDTHTFLLGTVTLSYLIIMLLISRLTNYSMNKSLEMRYENTTLVKELKKQTEQANQSCKDKSRFLASASHDLRQPIHSLSLLTSAITPEVKTTRGKEILHQIVTANDVMLDLLNSLLDISKLDADIIKPKLTMVDINEIIDSLMDEFQEIARANNIELRAKTSIYKVKTDPVLLSTILRNIIQNALLYTPKGKVLISCRKKKDAVLLQVWDTGKGIAKEYQEEVFAEFQQLHNPERDKNKGLGLGLAICKRLSEKLKVKISLKSVVDKGSVFSLEIPLLTTAEIKRCLSEKTPQKFTNVSQNFENLVVLIIDDNAIVLDAMTALLENWGCHVLTAESVRQTENIAKIQSEHDKKVDVIIADYRLRKNKTGVEAINKFIQIVNYSPPSLLITGDTSPERMQEISSHGFPVLHKPVKEPQLKVVIARLLRLST